MIVDLKFYMQEKQVWVWKWNKNQIFAYHKPIFHLRFQWSDLVHVHLQMQNQIRVRGQKTIHLQQHEGIQESNKNFTITI